MGRAPCCSKVGLHKGPWTATEDTLLTKYIHENGEGQWRSLPKKAGLLRCGKSCRLRWMNYLRPDIKRGNIGPDEEDLIIRLHKLLGNRWSLIAGRLPGRTDNEIKNYWNTHLSKRLNNNHGPPKAGHSQKKVNKNKSEKKKNESKDNVERMKTKIHLPKPIRLKSFPRNFHVMETNNSSGEVGTMDLGLLDDPLDQDVGLSAQSHVSNKDGMLEKLYEEYLDLLKQEEEGKLESLAESFWV